MQRAKLQVDHFAIPVFDVARAWRFYSETLGLELVSAFDGDDWGGKPWLMMIFAAADGRQVALCSLRGVKRPPSDKLHRLTSEGVAFDEEDHGEQRSIYFPDPDAAAVIERWIRS